MTPPGLSFVAANERAQDVHKKADMRTPYGTGASATATRITENMRHAPGLVFALRQAIRMLYEEGAQRVRTARLTAEAVRRAGRKMGRGPVLGFQRRGSRRADSNTVTTVTDVGDHDRPGCINIARRNAGVVLGMVWTTCRARRSASP